jgi:hypothetical protein
MNLTTSLSIGHGNTTSASVNDEDQDPLQLEMIKEHTIPSFTKRKRSPKVDQYDIIDKGTQFMEIDD